MNGSTLAAGVVALGTVGLIGWWLFRSPTPAEASQYAMAGAAQNPAPAAAWTPSIPIVITPFLVQPTAFAPRS